MKFIISIAVFPLFLASSLQARTIDLDFRAEPSFGSASEQILINKATGVQSGIWNTRRQKKSGSSIRLAPRKPRKKLNPDSMALNT